MTMVLELQCGQVRSRFCVLSLCANRYRYLKVMSMLIIFDKMISLEMVGNVSLVTLNVRPMVKGIWRQEARKTTSSFEGQLPLPELDFVNRMDKPKFAEASSKTIFILNRVTVPSHAASNVRNGPITGFSRIMTKNDDIIISSAETSNAGERCR